MSHQHFYVVVGGQWVLVGPYSCAARCLSHLLTLWYNFKYGLPYISNMDTDVSQKYEFNLYMIIREKQKQKNPFMVIR